MSYVGTLTQSTQYITHNTQTVQLKENTYIVFLVNLSLLFILCLIGGGVDVDTMMGNVFTNLLGVNRNKIHHTSRVKTEPTQGSTHPVLEGISLFQCERVCFCNDWHNVHIVVESLHELNVQRLQAGEWKVNRGWYGEVVCLVCPYTCEYMCMC